MGRKALETTNDVPPPGAGGGGYRKRAGKVGITVSATPAERDALRAAAARSAYRSMSAYLLALGLRDAQEVGRGE